MKTLKFTSFLVLLLILSATSLAQTPKDLYFKIQNPQIVYEDPISFFQFDVLIRASEAGKINGYFFILQYNEAAFGSNIVDNSKISWVNGPLSDMADTQPAFFSDATRDQPNGTKINVSFVTAFPGFDPVFFPTFFEDFSDEWQVFRTYRIEIADATQPAGVSFDIPQMEIAGGNNEQISLGGTGTGFAFVQPYNHNSHTMETTSLQYIANNGTWTPDAPDATSGTANATVWSGANTLSGDVVLNNLMIDEDIENPAVLNVEGFLTVNGTLTNDAGASGLVIVDDDDVARAPIRGSLINGTDNIPATVQLDIKAYTANDNGYHMIGSPVDNMTVAGSDFVPTPGVDDLFQWDEPTSIWQEYYGTGFSNFENGRGYLCAYATSGARNFVGNLNYANVSRSVSFTPGTGSGYNKFGNPFPSAIIWNNDTWSLPAGVNANTQIWDEASGNYIVVLPGEVIPKGNGFWIEATPSADGATVTIPAASKTHDTKAFYNTDQNTLDLRVEGGTNTFKDWINLRFMEGATDGYDLQYDMANLEGGYTSPQIAMESGEKTLTLNTLSADQFEAHIPVSFQAGTSGSHTFFVENNTLLFREAYLEDLFEGTTTDLQNNDSYTFDATTEDETGRFMLHILSTVGSDEFSIGDIRAYGTEDRLNILFKGNTGEDYTVELIALNGVKIFEQEVSAQPKVSIPMNLRASIYFVRISNKNAMETFKVFMGTL